MAMINFGKEAVIEPGNNFYEFSGKTIEVLVGNQTIYIDDQEYWSPNYSGVIEALTQRWNKISALE